ncbi:MAG: hypothetical protein V4736_04550 [Bdellovibrionota bacterium]
MKTSLVLLALIFSNVAVAQSLSEKIDKLFDGSTTPFPVESHLMQSFNSKSLFKGCSAVNENGSTLTLEGVLIARFTVTVKPDSGSTSAVKKHSVIATEWPTYFEDLKYFGGFYEGNGWNLDPIKEMNYCGHVAPASIFLQQVQSGVTSDGTAFYSQGQCNGKTEWTNYIKKSGSFLVQKRHSAEGVFRMYCWK